MTSKLQKVAITATETSDRSAMDHHFGRCRFFLIAEGDRIRVVENTARDASEGAGIKAAQLMIDNGVEAVITGSLGPKASKVLEEAGVRSYVGVSGNIKDVLERYREGRLETSSGAGSAEKVQQEN